MALSATMVHLQLTLSDVDRGVYEELDLRVARHPSESARYMLTRVLAYALSYEEGIAFSKGGLSDPDEPAVAIRDLTGVLVAWIDVGAPSAERLHKATKAARRVAVFTHQDRAALEREVGSRPVHKRDQIAFWCVSPALLEALEPLVGRNTRLELVRTEGLLYATVGSATVEGSLTLETLEP
jgi:uncharacterized protein YaeQ